jgi:hypothetical protein
MDCCPAPQSNVTTPPAEIAEASADSVQEVGVPLPTTVANAAWESRTVPASARSRPEIRIKMYASQSVRIERDERVQLTLRSHNDAVTGLTQGPRPRG